MADKKTDKKTPRPTITMFCDHCGETKTYFADDERTRPTSCKECLQGSMVEAINVGQ